MQVMTYSQFRAQLAAAIDSVNNRNDIVVVTRRGHKPVAMVPLDDIKGKWDETEYLLSTKANRKALAASRKQAEAGQLITVKWSKTKKTYVPA